MALLFYLSDQPKLPHPLRKHGVSDYLFDYAAHALSFGTLTLLFWRAITSWPTRWSMSVGENRLPWAGILSLLYAISDEMHQRFVPGRWSSLKDLAADAGGIVLALLAMWGWLAWRDRILGKLWQRLRNTRFGHWLEDKLSDASFSWMMVDA